MPSPTPKALTKSHMVHINLNMIYTAQSYQNNLRKVLYEKASTHTHTHTQTTSNSNTYGTYLYAQMHELVIRF